jgi:hypothetical protein
MSEFFIYLISRYVFFLLRCFLSFLLISSFITGQLLVTVSSTIQMCCHRRKMFHHARNHASRAASASCCILFHRLSAVLKWFIDHPQLPAVGDSHFKPSPTVSYLETVSEINHNSPAARNWFTNHRQLPAA